MSQLVMSAAAFLSNANALGVVIQADDGEGTGTNPMTFIPPGSLISTNITKGEIVFHRDNPVSEIRVKISTVTNQETWLVGEETTAEEALLKAFTDILGWVNAAPPA